MKLNNLIFSACIAAMGLSFTACNDDDIFTEAGKEAVILDGDVCCLKIVGNSGVTWKSIMDGNVITVEINPDLDPVEELSGVTAKFFVSKGATVTPDPAVPQDFFVEGGVKYTVTSEDGKTSNSYTVTYSSTAVPEYGKGFTRGTMVVMKKFPELGFPGEQANYSFSDSRQYGDLNGYVAYCGHDHIVLLARQYSDPVFDNPALATQDPDLALRVYTSDELNFVGNLNLGSINMKDVRAITSDMSGVMIAAVNNGSSCDLYTWTAYNAAPSLFGTVEGTLCSAKDGSNYLSIMGTLAEEANITGNAARDKDGNHYMIHVENGQITDTQVIKTGVRADDGNGFQMISPIQSTLNSSYLLGDVEGNGNGSIKVFAKTYKGTTKVIMGNVLHNEWEQWWVLTGINIARTGGRRPYVNGMLINGKHYAMLMNGTAWWWHNDIADLDDLKTRVTGTPWAYSTNVSWSFGGCGDWYWDGQRGEGHVVYYTDRYGIAVFRLTCF